MKKVYMDIVSVLGNFNVFGKMLLFEVVNISNLMFKVMCYYMCMVMEMLVFIRVVWIGDWFLYLLILEMFMKYFFVYDKINYVCMIFVYFVEMLFLKVLDLEIYEEFI